MEVRLKDTRSHGGQAQRHQRSWRLGLETLEVMEFRLRDTIGHAWRLYFETREVIKVRLRDTRGHVGQAQRHQRPWRLGLETLEAMEVRLRDTRGPGGQAQRHQRPWSLGVRSIPVTSCASHRGVKICMFSTKFGMSHIETYIQLISLCIVKIVWKKQELLVENRFDGADTQILSLTTA